MNYDRVILELMNRVCVLEEEVTALKQQLSSVSESAAPAAVVAAPVGVRDTTKYELNGKPYGKSRVALAIVKEYIKRNPHVTTFDELNRVFDKSIQGSLGCVRELEDVIKSYSQHEKRFFCKGDELIPLSDVKVAVCSQWDARNINRLIEHANRLGIAVTAR